MTIGRGRNKHPHPCFAIGTGARLLNEDPWMTLNTHGALLPRLLYRGPERFSCKPKRKCSGCSHAVYIGTWFSESLSIVSCLIKGARAEVFGIFLKTGRLTTFTINNSLIVTLIKNISRRISGSLTDLSAAFINSKRSFKFWSRRRPSDYTHRFIYDPPQLK
jgi:hypothetical protein